MLKEIYETKTAIKNILEYYSAVKSDNLLSDVDFAKIKRIKFVGCGTAYHACLLGAMTVEEKTGIECGAFVASEFRYSNPKIAV